MKHAKWLLLLAVGIVMVFPGCKKVNQALTPGVNIASITEEIWSEPLMTGGKQPQTQIGDVHIYWQYDYYDPDLDPGPDQNGQYVDLCLVVKYVTYSPDYPIADAHLNIDQNQPDGRMPPGHYNFNDYLQTPFPDPYTCYFVIPVADLESISGWDCGESVWMLCHVAAGGVTAMAGDFHHPRGQAWWNDLQLTIDNPTGGHNGDDEYEDETAWGYDIYNSLYWFWEVMEEHAANKWGGVIPYTLGGTSPTTVDLWAGAGKNDPSKGTKVGTVTVWDGYEEGEGTKPIHYVYVRYDITLSPWVLLEVHFGADPTLQAMYERTNFAPGLLGNTYEGLPELTTFTGKMEYNQAWGNSFVVAAHAKVAIPPPPAQMEVGAPQQ